MKRNLHEANLDLLGGVPPNYPHRQLPKLLFDIFTLMRDGEWRSEDEVAAHVGASVTSTGASIRDLRKPKFGAHVVLYRNNRGRHEYRLDLGAPR